MLYIYFFLLLLLLLSLSNVKITLILHRLNEDDNAEIKIRLLGFIKLNYKIPYVDIIFNRRQKLAIKVKKEVETKNKDLGESIEAFSLRKLKYYYEKARIYSKAFNKVTKYILSKMVLESIKWHTKIGLENAASTAVAAGAIWGIKVNILNKLVRSNSNSGMDIKVLPDYTRPVFEVDIVCIIRIKIANIIIAGVKVLYIFSTKFWIRKGGGANDRTSNSRVNENYNG